MGIALVAAAAAFYLAAVCAIRCSGLAEAVESLCDERGSSGAIDEEIEHEVAAARAAFAAARRSGLTAPRGSHESVASAHSRSALSSA